MQTKGQLVKNLNTAFSFAPPSILSLTIYPIKQILFYFFFYPITLAPNGMKESLAILKNCFPNGIPTIVIHHMQPAKIHASPPNNPPNINQRILPIVLMTTSPPYPMSNILLQFPLLSHISL